MRLLGADGFEIRIDLDGRRISKISGPSLPPSYRSLIGAFVKAPFADAHLHVLGLAQALAEPDLGPMTCPDIPSLILKLRELAPDVRRATGWAVARGFDESLIDERRLPTLTELDSATRDIPLRLRHRTGHASLLNSAGLAALRHLPPTARTQVDVVGEPVMVIGAEAAISGVVGRPSRDHILTGLRAADDFLLRNGTTRGWDATPRDPRAIEDFYALLDEARFEVELRSMLSSRALGTHSDRAALIKLFPDIGPDELRAAVREAHAYGACVAIHATEIDELEIALDALEYGGSRPRGDRIEHAMLCLPEQARRAGRLGVTIVASPAWLKERARKYEVLSDAERRWLLPLRSLREAGCGVAFGSDAPTSLAGPTAWISAATARGSEALDVEAAAEAACGAIVFDSKPDEHSFVIVDREQTDERARVLATCAGGRLHAWLADDGHPSV